MENRLNNLLSHLPDITALGLPVSEPNDIDENVTTWVDEVSLTENGEWVAVNAGMILGDFIRSATAAQRMLLLAVRDPLQLSAVEHEVWEAWGSSYTMLLAKEPGSIVKSCFTSYSVPTNSNATKPVFYTYMKDTESETVRETHLLVGPNGDYHIDPDVLKKLGVI